MKANGTPVWFLDFDGVVNVVGPPEGVASDHELDRISGYTICWRPTVVDFINQAHREGLARIMWLTTWGDSALTHLTPALGFDTFEVAVAHPPRDPHVNSPAAEAWWKLKTVTTHLQRHPHHRYLWTDDDIRGHHRDRLRENLALGGSVLALRTDTLTGLSDTNLDTITKFLTDTSATEVTP